MNERLSSKGGTSLRWLEETVATPTDECQEWPFRSTVREYGRVDHRLATHLALEMDGRPWHPPLGACALHSCDNPSCCNPRHLRWGTPRANCADKVQRQRHARGERVGRAKLTEADVLEIRDLFASGTYSQVELGSIYGVHSSSVSRLVRGLLWSHLTDLVDAS